MVPVEMGKRGRVAIQLVDQRQYLSAELAEGEPKALGVGSSVVIVHVDGAVAQVTHLDPELA